MENTLRLNTGKRFPFGWLVAILAIAMLLALASVSSPSVVYSSEEVAQALDDAEGEVAKAKKAAEDVVAAVEVDDAHAANDAVTEAMDAAGALLDLVDRVGALGATEAELKKASELAEAATNYFAEAVQGRNDAFMNRPLYPPEN